MSKPRFPLMFLVAALFASLVAPACSKPPDKEDKDSRAGRKMVRQVKMPASMLQLHYRLPPRSGELKTALTPLAGPAVAMVWPHLEGLRSFSAWVFEPPTPTPGQMTPPKFVMCLSGKATDWLYVANLQSPEGAPVSFQKDRMQKIRGPEGSHPVYFLQDRGGHACLGSTEALARDALDWVQPEFPADGLLRIQGNVPQLFSLGAQKDFASALDSMMALSGVTDKQLQEFKQFFAGMETFSLDVDLGPQLASLVRLEMTWKDAPGFFAAPGKSRIPFTDRTVADLHLEFDGGRWMGMELWPLFEQETSAELRPQVQKFLADLRSIDFQVAMVDGGRLASRVELRAEGQEAFLMEAAGKLMKAAAEEDKYSVKELEKSADVLAWEATPTAAEDASTRLVVNRLFGGAFRLESRKVPGGVVWTGGAWPEGKPAPLVDDNQRVVFAMLPFFNLVLPVIEEVNGVPEPRFQSFPSVPQDPWRLSVRFDPAKKAMTIETALPVGAWLRSVKDYPGILERMQKLDSPAPGKAAPPSDL
jgi:hypothetical protein